MLLILHRIYLRRKRGKMERKTIKVKDKDVYIDIYKYTNNRIALKARTEEEPYADITINLPDVVMLDYNEVFISPQCEIDDFQGKLIVDGIIQEVIKTIPYNYGTYNMVRLDIKKLEEYDPTGFVKYIDTEKIPYNKYTREEMSKIAKEEGYLLVQTSNYDSYIIRKKDVADFIMQESERMGHSVDINMYALRKNEKIPLLSTCGCFLDKINQNFRSEIINRLVELQTTDAKPKDVKVFDDEVFFEMSLEELGQNKEGTAQYEKFYKQYFETQEMEDSEEMEA